LFDSLRKKEFSNIILQSSLSHKWRWHERIYRGAISPLLPKVQLKSKEKDEKKREEMSGNKKPPPPSKSACPFTRQIMIS
jgi:hypothetical protein